MKSLSTVKCSLDKISSRLASLALSHTLPEAPKVLAVSKTKTPELILEAYHAGHRDFGENYVQEFVDKAKQLPEDIRWHMIGHVQSNKAKLLMSVPNLYVLETLDSKKLANKVNNIAAQQDRMLKVLVQVVTSDQGTKSGIDPSEVQVLVNYVLTSCAHLDFCGLMTMGKVGDIEGFETMQKLLAVLRVRFEELRDKELELSFGTSQDYETAALYGSTQVRVGSTIFGAREYPAQKVMDKM